MSTVIEKTVCIDLGELKNSRIGSAAYISSVAYAYGREEGLGFIGIYKTMACGDRMSIEVTSQWEATDEYLWRKLC